MLSANIKTFEDKLKRKHEKQCETFVFILDKCIKKMNMALDKGFGSVYFEVPEFIIGKPVYDLKDCIKFILLNLKHKGFEMKYFFPRVIEISWNNNIKKEDNINTKLTLPPPPQNESMFSKMAKQNKNKKLVLEV